jgi:hypothetical protein
VGSASWAGGEILIEGHDSEVARRLRHIFRPAPVVVDDAAMRSAGSAGPAVLQPGSLRWFSSAARSRAREEDLTVRLVPKTGARMGFDPAGLYRPFDAQDELRERSSPA